MKYKPDDYSDGHNHCRNPDGDKRGPWCYTVGNKRWGYCHIDKCDCEETCIYYGEHGTNYEGNISKTTDGIKCQRWDADYPHKTGANIPKSSHNYCRNPDDDNKGPWCYTTDQDTRTLSIFVLFSYL